MPCALCRPWSVVDLVAPVVRIYGLHGQCMDDAPSNFVRLSPVDAVVSYSRDHGPVSRHWAMHRESFYLKFVS